MVKLMKVKISKDDLLLGIQTVQNIVSPKATLPILSNMLVETKKDTLRLNTTDLDIGISCVGYSGETLRGESCSGRSTRQSFGVPFTGCLGRPATFTLNKLECSKQVYPTPEYRSME